MGLFLCAFEINTANMGLSLTRWNHKRHSLGKKHALISANPFLILFVHSICLWVTEPCKLNKKQTKEHRVFRVLVSEIAFCMSLSEREGHGICASSVRFSKVHPVSVCNFRLNCMGCFGASEKKSICASWNTFPVPFALPVMFLFVPRSPLCLGHIQLMDQMPVPSLLCVKQFSENTPSTDQCFIEYQFTDQRNIHTLEAFPPRCRASFDFFLSNIL